MTKQSLPVDILERGLALDPRQSFAVSAPAGSGKTTNLEAVYLSRLLHSDKPEQVLVVTFTNAAAAEIRSRIASILAKASSYVTPSKKPVKGSKEYTDYLASLVMERDKKLKWYLAINPARMRIVTFDAYAATIAEELPILSDQFNVGKVTDDAYLVYRQAVIDLFEHLDDKDCPQQLRESLEKVMAHGKNRVESMVDFFASLLASRDQWVGIASKFDFSDIRKIIEDMNDEAIGALKDLCLSSDFTCGLNAIVAMSGVEPKLEWANSLSIDALKAGDINAWKHLGSLMLTTSGTFRKRVTKREGFINKSDEAIAVNDMLDFVSASSLESHWLKLNSIVTSAALDEDEAAISSMFVVLRYLLAHLSIQFREQGVQDFTQIALTAQQSLGGEDIGFGDALLREDSMRHILVDEFQDTSISQMRTLEILTSEWADYNQENPDCPKTLYFCGDSAQSIYMFRGAEPGIFTDIINSGEFNGIPMTHLKLTANFRSSKKTVEYVNHIGSQVFKEKGDSLTGDAEFVRAVAQRDTDGEVNIHGYEVGDEESAAEAVTERVKALLAASDDKDIAILTPARNKIAHIVKALEGANIPVAGMDIDLIAKKPSVSIAASLIKALWHEGDDVSWVALLKSTMIGFSWEDLVKLKAHADLTQGSYRSAVMSCDAVQGISSDGLHRAQYLRQILLGSELNPSISTDLFQMSRHVWLELKGDRVNGQSGIADVRRVFDVLRSSCKGGRLTSIQAFDRKINKLYAESISGARVKVMTIHASKGLEFDHVLLVGLSHAMPADKGKLMRFTRIGNTTIPGIQPLTDRPSIFGMLKGIESTRLNNESKRLFYVATTRQKETLDIFAPISEGSNGPTTIKGTMFSNVFKAHADYIDNMITVNRSEVQLDLIDPSSGYSVLNRSVAALSELTIKHDIGESTEFNNKLDSDLNHAEFNLTQVWRSIEGTAVHHIIDQVVRLDVQDPDQFVNEHEDGLRAFLIKNGYPRMHIDAGISLIKGDVMLLMRDKECANHIRNAINHGASEQRFTRVAHGKFLDRYLDMVYMSNAEITLLDIKTDRKAIGESDQDFALRLVNTYQGKMGEYADMLGAAYKGKQVKQYLLSSSLGKVIPITNNFKNIA